jgi:hypothetical protein
MPEMTQTTKPKLFSSAPGYGKRDGKAYIGYVRRPDRRKMGCCWIVTFKPKLFSSAPGCGKRDGKAYIGYVRRPDRRKMGCCWTVSKLWHKTGRIIA